MKLGVLGGTFDPLHLGHLHVARQSKKLFGLAEVHFVVASAPPHKQAGIALHHRFAMVCLATAGSRDFIPSLVELEAPASPYSIHTLAKLARRLNRNPRDLHFIAGGDSLLDVSRWKKGSELLCRYNFVFVERPGIEEADLSGALPLRIRSRLRDLRGMGSSKVRDSVRREERSSETRIFVVDLGAPDISSSQIRSLAAAGRRFRHLVPATVHEYIQKLRVYDRK